MSKPRGHSNLYANEAQPHPGNANIAIVRISGGASPYRVKDLPPLSLSRDEWQTIGERMGWTTDAETALRDICEHPTLGKVRPTGVNRVRNYTFTPEQLQRARAALGME